MTLSDQQIRALLKLTNPALHGGSELSVRATAFLERLLIESKRPKQRRKSTRKIRGGYSGGADRAVYSLPDDPLPEIMMAG